MNIFAMTGSVTLGALRETGRISEFAGRGAVAWVMGPFYWRAFFPPSHESDSRLFPWSG
jgi:hypothetical protein